MSTALARRLNPLESGRCFLRLAGVVLRINGGSSQSPRIGAVFPTHVYCDVECADAESQSPRIGAVFPTVQYYSAWRELSVSIPSNRGGVSYSRTLTRCLSKAKRLNPLESGRCFLHTDIIEFHGPEFCLNPLESGRCFLRRANSYCAYDYVCLNPLESGRCFLLHIHRSSGDIDTMSQSPRIGAVFPTPRLGLRR